jgi:hypothetical protein
MEFSVASQVSKTLFRSRKTVSNQHFLNYFRGDLTEYLEVDQVL